MGIWGFNGSTTEAVKRNAPDMTPVKNTVTKICSTVTNAGRTSYSYGSASVANIDQTVRINGLYKLGQWMPGDETKSKIAMYSVKLAKNAGLYALQESYKLIPGGVAVSKIVKDTVKDVQLERSVKLKALEENLGSSKKHSSGRIGPAEKDDKEWMGMGSVPDVELKADRSPEDVIRVFMMKDLFTTHFFDDAVVHQPKGKKRC